jgi:hypothetical protein
MRLLLARSGDGLWADWKRAMETVGDLSLRLLRADPASWHEAMRAADARKNPDHEPLETLT